MAGTAKYTITLSKDWQRLLKASNPSRFRKLLTAHMRVATERNGVDVMNCIRRKVQEAKFDPNSELTKLLKGSSKPLINSSTLARNINYALENAFVGLAGTNRNREGANIAYVLHEGATLKMTDERRRWLARAIAMAYKKMGRDYQGKEGTGYTYSGGVASPTRGKSNSFAALIIPSRPFIESAFDDALIKRILERWSEACYQAIKAAAR
jgi:hypothetical protein